MDAGCRVSDTGYWMLDARLGRQVLDGAVGWNSGVIKPGNGVRPLPHQNARVRELTEIAHLHDLALALRHGQFASIICAKSGERAPALAKAFPVSRAILLGQR